jgi:molybdopterin-guanine dinucleotide biosynthesis protein A
MGAHELAAVILTGGTAVRMDGVDKAALELDGATLLERALTATAAASEVVVVGDPVPTSRPVTWTREQPPGGGPAAGLLAGVDALREPHDLVAVLAVDMPHVTTATLARLVGARRDDVDGALLVDESGRRQLLCGVHRRSALQRVRPARADEHGLPVKRLLRPLRLLEVPALPGEAGDVDTWEDLRALRERP